uniref:Interferon-related developmental regulator 1 n=1 Tax=Erpetoichthys calabaricus TaxID=27687 RepID=A0A8C4T1H0_ERPCA
MHIEKNIFYLEWIFGNLVYLFCSVLTGGQHRSVQPFSDEEASVETLSHCSSFSDSASDTCEESTQEDFEYKLKGLIDCTMDKCAKTRQSAVEGLKTAMANKLLYEFILERRMTLTDSIERCLKKVYRLFQYCCEVFWTLHLY